MASRKKEGGIQRHSHCIVCGVAISENETLCGDKCRGEYEKMLKRQKYSRLAAFLPVIIVIVFFAAAFLFRGR